MDSATFPRQTPPSLSVSSPSAQLRIATGLEPANLLRTMRPAADGQGRFEQISNPLNARIFEQRSDLQHYNTLSWGNLLTGGPIRGLAVPLTLETPDAVNSISPISLTLAKTIIIQTNYDTEFLDFKKIGHSIILQVKTDIRGAPISVAIITKTSAVREYIYRFPINKNGPDLALIARKFDLSIRSGLNHLAQKRRRTALPIMKHTYDQARRKNFLTTSIIHKKLVKGVLVLVPNSVKILHQRSFGYNLASESTQESDVKNGFQYIKDLKNIVDKSGRSLDPGDKDDINYEIERLLNLDRLTAQTKEAVFKIAPDLIWNDTVAHTYLWPLNKKFAYSSDPRKSLAIEKEIVKKTSQSLTRFANHVTSLSRDISNARLGRSRRSAEAFQQWANSQGLIDQSEILHWYDSILSGDNPTMQIENFRLYMINKGRDLYKGLPLKTRVARFKSLRTGLVNFQVLQLTQKIHLAANSLRARWFHRHMDFYLNSYSPLDIVKDTFTLAAELPYKDFKSMNLLQRWGRETIAINKVTHSQLSETVSISPAFNRMINAKKLQLYRSKPMKSLKSDDPQALRYRNDIDAVNYITAMFQTSLKNLTNLRSRQVLRTFRQSGYKQVRWTDPNQNYKRPKRLPLAH
jgi:hypothetical protein